MRRMIAEVEDGELYFVDLANRIRARAGNLNMLAEFLDCSLAIRQFFDGNVEYLEIAKNLVVKKNIVYWRNKYCGVWTVDDGIKIYKPEENETRQKAGILANKAISILSRKVVFQPGRTEIVWKKVENIRNFSVLFADDFICAGLTLLPMEYADLLMSPIFYNQEFFIFPLFAWTGNEVNLGRHGEIEILVQVGHAIWLVAKVLYTGDKLVAFRNGKYEEVCKLNLDFLNVEESEGRILIYYETVQSGARTLSA